MRRGLFDLQPLRDRTAVFADRAHAGRLLAGLLDDAIDEGALVLAVPAGGVPVADGLAGAAGLEWDVFPVSKALLPWTTEAGFGAVASDGTTWIDEDRVRAFGLTDEQVRRALAEAREKAARRALRFRGTLEPPRVSGRPVVLVDDGLASGATMRAAVESLLRAGSGPVVLAVPTAALDSARRLLAHPGVLSVRCANLRSGPAFAVADAYRRWRDVSEEEALALYRRSRSPRSGRERTNEGDD